MGLNLIKCLLFAALLHLSCFLNARISFSYVPVNFCLTVCLVAGGYIGGLYASISVIIYAVSLILDINPISDITINISYLYETEEGRYILFLIPSTYVSGVLCKYFYKDFGSRRIKFASLFVSMSFGVTLLLLMQCIYFAIAEEKSFLYAAAISILPQIWVSFFQVLISVPIAMRLMFLSEMAWGTNRSAL